MNIGNTISLFLFHKLKKDKLTHDIELPFWTGITKDDVGIFVTNIVLDSGEIAKCRLAKVTSSTGINSYGVYFDIEQIGDRKPIRQTSFKEFKKEYSNFFYIKTFKGVGLYGISPRER